jgi:hypothetical protein
MTLDQLTGRYFRLRRELAAAYSVVPWNTGRIARVTNDLAVTEREITVCGAAAPRPMRKTQTPRGTDDRASTPAR